MMHVLTGLLSLGLFFIFGDVSFLWPVLGLVYFFFCISGWGMLGLQKIQPKLILSWDVVVLAGMGFWGIVTVFLLGFGIWNIWIVGLLISLGGLGWIQNRCVRPHFSESLWFGLAAVGLVTSIDVWGPMIDTDALYYHQALAKQMSMRATLIGGWFEPNGSRPMLLHSVYASMWLFLGERGPSLLHWFLSMTLVASVLERSKGGVWGLLLLVSSWSFVQEMGVLSNNLPTALAVFLTWRMVCSKHDRVASFFAFMALSYKLTSLGLIAGIWLFYVVGVRRKIKLMAIVCSLFSIWLVRNIGTGLSPLFPFSGWDEPFQNLSKYGMGRTTKDFILLPWNVFVHAHIDNHIFQGRLSPMLLGGVLAWKYCSKKETMLFLWSCIFWAMGPQWLRHAMLIVPIWVFLVSPHVRGAHTRYALVVGFLLGMSSNWGPLFSRWSDSWEVIRGDVQEEVFLHEHVVGYEALRWVDQKIPKESCPALLFVWSGAVLNRPYILSSVEDHIPVRAWLNTYGEDAFTALECDYVVVGNPAMNRKKYSFLSDDMYAEQVKRPLSLLEELLLKRGTLVFTAKGTRIYRIEK